MTNEQVTPEFIAEVCAPHWTVEQRTLVCVALGKHTQRFATLLSAHGGDRVTPKECAALFLRLAKRVAHEDTENGC